MVQTWNEVFQVAHSLGWHITYEMPDMGNLYEVDFSVYSPAGEDFNFDVSVDDPAALARKVRDYWWNFDADEHVKSVMDMRGAPGLRELIDDADAIEEMLHELSDALMDYEGGVE